MLHNPHPGPKSREKIKYIEENLAYITYIKYSLIVVL